MKKLFLFIIFFFSISFCENVKQNLEKKENLEISLRKKNSVSIFLNKILNEIFEGLSKGNLTLGDRIDLGEEVGHLRDVVLAVPGGVERVIDGLGSWGVKVDAGAEKMMLGGKYDLLHLDVPMLFPFFGKGNFLVSLEGITFKMTLNAKFDFGTESFNFEIPRFKIIINKSKVEFENLMDDPFLADFLNELISNLIPDLIEMLNEPLQTAAKSFADDYGNGIFYCIKNELATGKIKECITDLFKKSLDQSFLNLLKDHLTERYNKTNY